MKIFDKITSMRNETSAWLRDGFTIGLVPTMGALHEGHGSLIETSVKNNDKTVVSVFVNPIQFGPNEDFESYPRNLKKDAAFAEKIGADALFHPTPEEMYEKTPLTSVKVKGMSGKLCGVTRPAHFEGVTTVIAKLFNITSPHNAYFGLKDFQQYLIIKKMTADLNYNVNIIGMPIIRDKDGLAMSSRNLYLSSEERKSALSLSESLKLALDMAAKGEKDPREIIKAVKKRIEGEPFCRIDYVNIIDPDTFEDTPKMEKGMVLLLAVYVGKTRLIDNAIL